MKALELNPRELRPELLPNFAKRFVTPSVAHIGHHLDGDIVHELVSDACAIGVSDIHINPHRDGARIRIRVDGTVFDVAHLNTEDGKMLVNQFKALANLDPIVRFNPRDAHASLRVK